MFKRKASRDFRNPIKDLKYKGAEILESLKGKVYQKTIEKSELNLYKENFQVISERLFLGKPTIHIVSDTNPGEGFIAINAELEDVYFSEIFNVMNAKSI